MKAVPYSLALAERKRVLLLDRFEILCYSSSRDLVRKVMMENMQGEQLDIGVECFPKIKPGSLFVVILAKLV